MRIDSFLRGVFCGIPRLCFFRFFVSTISEHSLLQFHLNCVRDVLFSHGGMNYLFIRVNKVLITRLTSLTNDFLALKLTFLYYSSKM